MKNLLLALICAMLCLLPAAGQAYCGECVPYCGEHMPYCGECVPYSGEHVPYHAEFTRDGIYPENAPPWVLFFSQEALLEFSEAEMYSEYDREFFEKNNLILALLERGSGSLRFSLESVLQCGDTLTVRIKRYSPPIQTMDYRTHVLMLSIKKSAYNSPRINVVISG